MTLSTLSVSGKGRDGRGGGEGKGCVLNFLEPDSSEDVTSYPVIVILFLTKGLCVCVCLVMLCY